MIDAGTRLAAALSRSYRLERELGAGGMATVYLAQDLRHDRRVAIKVLRPELAAVIGAERFLKEIKTTANLQHPHILGLIDSGEVDGLLWYAMPFVEGESLRDRLQREKQLPIADAVRIASEVAGALDYAHRHGVIHRDIKPENILLHDGSALVADFGIALAASTAGTRMTETGMSLGTPHYMSPEQAMGEREITARSDVYALGCVTYEMLAGDPPFTGSTAQAIVAKVVTEQPRSLTAQRHTVPEYLEAAVLTALEKLPADRFATAAEFAEALSGRGAISSIHLLRAAGSPAAKAWRGRFWIATAVAIGGLGLALSSWLQSRRSASVPVSRQYITAGTGLAIATDVPSLALSPDGSKLVFVAAAPNGPLYLKRRADLNPVAIPGTEGGTNPAFSPDGEWVAFVGGGQVKKIRVEGGSAVNVADSAGSGLFAGVAWLDDNTLVYVASSLITLKRVSADGGVSTGIATTQVSALQGRGTGDPVALPGSRGVLFRACTSGCATMDVDVLDLGTGRQKLLLPGAAQAWYIGDGRLLYVRRDGAALVAPFDLRRLELTGAGVPIMDGILVNNGHTELAWSPSGTLVYLAGTGNTADNEVVRVTRRGVATPIDTAWFGAFNSLELSPDGRRVAVGVGSADGELNIWVKQLDRGPFSRLTFSGRDRRPAWSPDGRMVAFIRDTTFGLVMAHRSDGSGADVPLVRMKKLIQEIAWSPDGRWIVARTDNGAPGAGDILGIRTDGDSTPVPLAATPFTELSPALSPDGRWLAYASNESGHFEVYVRPFPNASTGRWQVSVGGGDSPRWSRDSREIYFVSPTKQMMSASMATQPGFAVRIPVPLFSGGDFRLVDVFHQSYDVLPDGQFLLLAPHRTGANTGAPRIVWVDNWLSDLKARRHK